MINAKYRKCVNGEIDKIIEVADKSFLPDRYKNFSFRTSVPQIYDNKIIDYSSSHFIAENERGFVAVVGNLIDSITAQKDSFKMSRIGTVGTIPEERGRGHMKNLMQLVDKENINGNVDFSVLNGKRNRYLNYGYERGGFSCDYYFDLQQKAYIKKEFDLKIIPFNRIELDDLYTIYLQNIKPVLRSKDNFENFTNNSVNELYSIFENEKVIGYLTIKRNRTVTELACLNKKYFASVISILLNSDKLNFETNKYNDKYFIVEANLLQSELCDELDKICNNKVITDSYSIKVYNVKNFIKFVYSLNQSCVKHEITEAYNIAGTTYLLNVKNQRLILDENASCCANKDFNKLQDFVQFMLGNKNFADYKSQIFPLKFGLNSLDLF